MAAGLVYVGAAGQPGGDGADHSRIAFYETADVIAITPVPLGCAFR
jgi:hypothetical protein